MLYLKLHVVFIWLLYGQGSADNIFSNFVALPVACPCKVEQSGSICKVLRSVFTAIENYL